MAYVKSQRIHLKINAPKIGEHLLFFLFPDFSSLNVTVHICLQCEFSYLFAICNGRHKAEI